jgi:AraC-like DNA-binding protein
MRVERLPGLRAGFHATADSRATGLVHAGEQWASESFAVAPHDHDAWELYLQVHGTTTWRSPAGLHRLTPGELLAVAPGVEHELARRPRTSHHFCYAAIDLAVVGARHPALASAWPPGAAVRHLTGGERLLPAFGLLARELRLQLPYGEAGVTAAVDALVVEASRVLAAPGAGPVMAVHPAVTAVRALLDEQLDRRWGLTELAGHVGLSPAHLHALFTAEVGATPHRYHLEQRVRRAQELLATTELPVTVVALELGFSSGQQLARTLRRETGRTPTEHRRVSSARRPPSR